MNFLSPFGKSLAIFRDTKTVSRINNKYFENSWQGRMVSTRPTNCSKKCKQFNPKKSCCKKDDDDLDLLTNPIHSWHPCNIFHDFPNNGSISSFHPIPKNKINENLNSSNSDNDNVTNDVVDFDD